MKKIGVIFVSIMSLFLGIGIPAKNNVASFPGVHVLNATGISNGIVLNAIVSPSDASDKYVNFVTSNKMYVNFVRIDDDSINVYAVKAFTGSVTITASISSFTAICSCVYDNGGFSQG